jgi:hypothetical protein
MEEINDICNICKDDKIKSITEFIKKIGYFSDSMNDPANFEKKEYIIKVNNDMVEIKYDSEFGSCDLCQGEYHNTAKISINKLAQAVLHKIDLLEFVRCPEADICYLFSTADELSLRLYDKIINQKMSLMERIWDFIKN